VFKGKVVEMGRYQIGLPLRLTTDLALSIII